MRWTAIIALSLVLAFSVAGLQGCQLADHIKVATPIGVQQSEGLPARVPLSQARGAYTKWRAGVQADDAEWRESIEGGENFVALLNTAGLQFLAEYGPMIGGVPVAGPIGVGLLPIAGFLFGQGRLRRQKESSYNAGMAKAKELVEAPAGGVVSVPGPAAPSADAIVSALANLAAQSKG